MWPWGHLGVAYVLASAALRRTGRRPDAGVVAAAALGSQLPDLVDKPLAWSLAVLPTGRTLGHSLLVGLPLVLVVAAALARRGRPTWGAALGGGHLSHVLVDALPVLWRGSYGNARFLLWPATPPVDYGVAQTLLAHLAALEPSPYQGLQAALLAAAVVLWNRDGRPGVDAVVERVAAGLARVRDAVKRVRDVAARLRDRSVGR